MLKYQRMRLREFFLVQIGSSLWALSLLADATIEGKVELPKSRAEDRPIPSQTYDKPGLVTLRCDIHEHMRGLILVVNTRYFVISDADGRFRLRGLPSGRYTLKAWIDSKTTLAKPVALKTGDTI